MAVLPNQKSWMERWFKGGVAKVFGSIASSKTRCKLDGRFVKRLPYTVLAETRGEPLIKREKDLLSSKELSLYQVDHNTRHWTGNVPLDKRLSPREYRREYKPLGDDEAVWDKRKAPGTPRNPWDPEKAPEKWKRIEKLIKKIDRRKQHTKSTTEW